MNSLIKQKGQVKSSNTDGHEGQRYQGCKISVPNNNRKPHIKHRPGNDLMCYSAQSFSY